MVVEIGLSFIHNLRSAVCIYFCVDRGIVERVLNIYDLQSAICIYLSGDKGVRVGVSVIHDLQSAICIFFIECRG